MIPVNNQIPVILPADFHSAKEAVSSAMTAATSEIRSHEEYHAIWQEWERDAPWGEEEARRTAVGKLRDCLQQDFCVLTFCNLPLSSLPELPANLISLMLNYSGLTTLPALPRCLERLDVACNKLTTLPELPQYLQLLDASDNRLTQLPELPSGVKVLNVSYNSLTALPTLPQGTETLTAKDNRLTETPELPESLSVLDLSNNLLTELSALPHSLTHLNAGNNHLTEPPRLLPQSLESINLFFNQITEFPPSLPSSLRRFNLMSNQLSRLPESILRLHHSCQVNVEHNPLARQTMRSLRNLTSDPTYQGPVIHFSIDDGYREKRPVPPLVKVVAIWLAAESDTAKKWTAIATEANASVFSAFLNRLADTVSAKKDAEFNQNIVTWLTMLANSPALREMTFMVASGASTTCEDRVLHSWNEMQKLALVHRVESGEFDDKLPNLAAAGRVMFRLERLEEIAREKVKTLWFVDEIEVFQAFRTMLRDNLALSSVAKEMYYFHLSGVSGDDLKVAEIMVKTAENSTFFGWFSQWTPWHKVLERSEPTSWQQFIEAKYKIFEEDYPHRVASELAAASLTGNADAERNSGKKVMEEMEKEISAALTLEVLTARNLASLINWQWDLSDSRISGDDVSGKPGASFYNNS